MATDDAGGSAGEAVSKPWEPLAVVDVVCLGLAGTLQGFALLICMHLIWWRKWPPYVTKNVNLVIMTTVSGVLWTIVSCSSLGFVRWKKGDILAACALEKFLEWSTLCTHTAAFFVRVYRMWRILIKHDDRMWHAGHQVLLMSSVSLIPVASTWAAPHAGYFNENTNTCPAKVFVVLVMNGLGFLGILFLWFVCARQLKTVRKQFNEYGTMKRTLLYMTTTLASYVVFFLLADDFILERRIGIFYPVVTTFILLWGSIREPLLKKVLGDDEYLWSFTKGFAELPSPAQLTASLAEQLSVSQLREEFRRYITAKVAEELVEFYLDSLDREEVKGFFKRQAITMSIVERYIRAGGADQVNISGQCREKIMETDVTAYDIFNEARAEVLAVMETNFHRGFVATEGFQRLLDASEEEQRELRMLRAGGMLPPGTPSTPIPAAGEFPASSSSARAAGNRRLPKSPSILVGLVGAFQKLLCCVKSPKGAPEARRRRHKGGGEGGARVCGPARVSVGCVGASSSGGREDGGAPIDADVALAPRLQREEGAKMLEARQVARSEFGGAADAEDVEMGERDAMSGRFGVHQTRCRRS